MEISSYLRGIVKLAPAGNVAGAGGIRRRTDAWPQVPPTSTTGKALNYLRNEWDKLIRYLVDGHLEIDNNATERAIWPCVIGGRNWLLANTQCGGSASANLYGLIETAKANNIDFYVYLRYIFLKNCPLPRLSSNWK